MNKAVIFDFDGVIINSSEVQKQALMESYRLVVGEGQPSVEEFFSHSGDSLQNIFTKMGLPLEMIKPYRKFSKERMEYIKVYTGIEEFLAYLNKTGVKCGLCTGKDRERTIEILRKIGFEKYFEVIVCSDDVSNPKPNPESLLLSIKLLGADIENSIMVGDAKNDILCAKAANVRSIAVSWGDTNICDLKRALPDYFADSIEELNEHINSALDLDKSKCIMNYSVIAESF